VDVHSSPRRNVELKAIDPTPEHSRECCELLGASDRGVLHQRDTYFHVTNGGLKLREQQPGQAHLIQFERPDAREQRESRYRIIEVDDGEQARSALASALGVRATVTKDRRLFIWQTVRIHLDDVEGLGTFIELEAVAPPQSDLLREYQLITELRQRLGITDERLVGIGYAKLLAERSAEVADRP
jgi:adenylate cyclase class 2